MSKCILCELDIPGSVYMLHSGTPEWICYGNVTIVSYKNSMATSALLRKTITIKLFCAIQLYTSIYKNIQKSAICTRKCWKLLGLIHLSKNLTKSPDIWIYFGIPSWLDQEMFSTQLLHVLNLFINNINLIEKHHKLYITCMHVYLIVWSFNSNMFL